MPAIREIDQKIDPFHYELGEILVSAWHMDATRPLDRLFRYQSFLTNHVEWQTLTFEGKTVLEIGCGPLLGWAPIAIYLGCKKYICVEPGLRENPVEKTDFLNGYFLPLYRHLEATIGQDLSFPEFKDNLSKRINTYFSPIEHCALQNNGVDIVISNNVLQHVLDLEGCFTQIRSVSGAHTQQFHNVHFTDHFGVPEKPFDGIYSISPSEYFKTESLLNLKRPSEMLALFSRFDLPVRLVPYYSETHLSTEMFDPYWKAFGLEDLAIHVGFFIT